MRAIPSSRPVKEGMLKWGEIWDKSLRTIFVEASLKAIEDAGVDHIDSMYVGCMSSGLFVGQEHLGPLMADYLGVTPIPATRVESACASGGSAFRQGLLDVASGMSEIVLVGGVEKMTDVDGGGATYALATAADQEYEVYNGVTFPGLYAMMARAHMHKYGTTREQLAMVSVKNHENGSKNPHAQYPFKVTVDQVMSSVMVSDPLRILDCSPIMDGAAEVAAKKAYEMAGCGPDDIDLAEVHDCFTIAEICAIEALGFVERGKGGIATESGETAIGGRISINTSGGLKSKGHPVGATGVAQICEITELLRGESGKRQVEGARRGLAQNMGGTCASSLVHILEVA